MYFKHNGFLQIFPQSNPLINPCSMVTSSCAGWIRIYSQNIWHVLPYSVGNMLKKMVKHGRNLQRTAYYNHYYMLYAQILQMFATPKKTEHQVAKVLAQEALKGNPERAPPSTAGPTCLVSCSWVYSQPEMVIQQDIYIYYTWLYSIHIYHEQSSLRGTSQGTSFTLKVV